MPGRSFTFRYRFEGSDGTIHGICERIAAESGEAEHLPEEEDGTRPDPGEVMRLNEILLKEAMDSLSGATESSPLAASGTSSASPQLPQ